MDRYLVPGMPLQKRARTGLADGPPLGERRRLKAEELGHLFCLGHLLCFTPQNALELHREQLCTCARWPCGSSASSPLEQNKL